MGFDTAFTWGEMILSQVKQIAKAILSRTLGETVFIICVLMVLSKFCKVKRFVMYILRFGKEQVRATSDPTGCREENPGAA